MLKTLRGYLVLSHILPPLVIIPLMGIVLIYFLENRLILPGIINQMADQAVIIAHITRSQPQIFEDSQFAESTLEDFKLETPSRIMILNNRGILLASSEPEDAYRLNQVLNTGVSDTRGIDQALQGNLVKHLDYSSGLQGDAADVFAPVTDLDGHLLGIVRLTYRYSTVAEQLISVRYLIVLILTIGTAFSAGLGLFLALNLGHTIQQASMSILELVHGIRVDPLPEHGPLEIKTLQQAFNFLVARLHELEQNRKQLLSNLVHELGRPLGGLSMGLQVLRRGAKDDPQTLDELLEGMEIEVKVLRRLIEDLSILYDNIIGTHGLDFQMVALSEWLPAILHSDQEVARKNGLQWIIDIPKDLPQITIDPQRIAQVIGNLTDNAIKYTPRGGSINVTAGESEKWVWIRVSDTGPGIPVEEQEKVFEPFYRGMQKQRIKQGMGLGLHIAKDFVIAHHGRLEVESSPGLGSCFTILLPKIVNIRSLTSSD